jgi:hypothetical protein
MITYTCVGSVRGSCGIHHESLSAAARCCARDQRACSSLGSGAYSDRHPTRADGRELGELEQEELDAFELAQR